VTSRRGAGGGPAVDELFAQAVARHEAGAVAEAEKLYRAVLQRDSGHLGARCNIAYALHHLGNLEAAARAYLWLVSRGVQSPEIQNGLGMALQELGRPAEARAAFRRGLVCHPESPHLLNSLGIALRSDDHRLDEAISAYRRAVSVDSAHGLAHLNLGNAYREQGELALSIGCYRQCLSLRPDFGAAHHNLAMALLSKGDFAAGWEEFEWRRTDVRRMGQSRDLAGPEWRGEPIEGGKLLLYAEEGLGTTIQFARYAPLAAARGLEVTLEVQEPLAGLVSSLPGVRTIAAGQVVPSYDAHCSLLSLPRLFKTDLQTIPASTPYLSADPARIAAWREKKMADRQGLTVGIAWRGNPHHMRDRKRSLSLAWFLDRLDRPGIDVVSLQKDFTRAEFPSSRERTRFLDAGRDLTDFAETAALVATLDLVISVDTAVCHLAGALGVPVWTLLDHAPDWRWLLDRSDTPWYPAMRLFRQSKPGDWDGVAEQVAKELAGFNPRR